MKNVLVLAAHPDDETFGLAGTIIKHSKKGDDVFVLVFSDGESARKFDKKIISKRKEDAKKACNVMGVKKIKFLNYEDQKLDIIPLVELVKQIESIIDIWKPEIVYTHFGGDLNQDHRRVFEATMVAARPMGDSFPKKILCYEIPSSTEWGISEFKPNFFVDVENEMPTKIKACNFYKNQFREFPHPLSKKSIPLRNQHWGTVSGKKYAEAFLLMREIS